MASVGVSQIKRIKDIISTRRDVCKVYNQSFRDIEGLKIFNADYENISPFMYVVRVLNGKRELLIEHLRDKHIDTGIHWNPVHKFDQFSKSKCGDLSITEKISGEILTLPLHSFMKKEHITRVVDGVCSFFKK